MAIARYKQGDQGGFVWTNSTGSSATAGKPLVIKDTVLNKKSIVIIPCVTIANGSSGQVWTSGEWNIDANTSRALAAGQRVKYVAASDVCDNESTATAALDFEIGMCTVAKAAATDNVDVLLNEYPIYS
jgi:hypothetical protein